MGGTATLKNKLYNAAVIDDPVYLALYSGDEDADELSPTGYVRVLMDFADPTVGVGTNQAPILFPAFTGAGGDITHVALHDAVSGGNRLSDIVALTGLPLTWESGVPVVLLTNAVTFTVT